VRLGSLRWLLRDERFGQYARSCIILPACIRTMQTLFELFGLLTNMVTSFLYVDGGVPVLETPWERVLYS
jgi:hypothetical protein